MEACGYLLIRTFCVNLAEQRTIKIPQTDFKADIEFPVIVDKLKPGNKPSCDGPICAIVCSNVKKIVPLILYEYKSVVDVRLEKVNHHSLMEVLIQGYYCLCQYNARTVIQCLTDLGQWYYFRVDKVSSAKLKYAWYKSISERKLSLKSHLDFLHHEQLDHIPSRSMFARIKLLQYSSRER